MPAQKRLRRHHQAGAPARRKQSSERSKQRSIGWSQPRAPPLPAEHGELMAQHKQLNVFGELAAPTADQQPQHSRKGASADALIARRQEQQGRALSSGARQPGLRSPPTIW
jgi:hypothetical protein